MSRRLLIPLVMFALACMGAECGGGSSSSSSSNDAAQTSAAVVGGDEDVDEGAPPVPEPSAALVFGSGLLLAGIAFRRNRRA